jgi:hypothetical protein
MLIVDPITGAMYQIDTPSVNMSLAPSSDGGSGKLKRLKALYKDGFLSKKEYQQKRQAVLAGM